MPKSQEVLSNTFSMKRGQCYLRLRTTFNEIEIEISRSKLTPVRYLVHTNIVSRRERTGTSAYDYSS